MKRLCAYLVFGLVIGLGAATAGTFGPGSFENDTALDWIGNELRLLDPQKAVEHAIQVVNKTTEYLEAPPCHHAIAASEVIAAALGRPSKGAPKEILAAAKKMPSVSEGLRRDARAALDKVTSKSELRELWSESKKFPEWIKAVEELKARL